MHCDEESQEEHAGWQPDSGFSERTCLKGVRHGELERKPEVLLWPPHVWACTHRHTMTKMSPLFQKTCYPSHFFKKISFRTINIKDT